MIGIFPFKQVEYVKITVNNHMLYYSLALYINTHTQYFFLIQVIVEIVLYMWKEVLRVQYKVCMSFSIFYNLYQVPAKFFYKDEIVNIFGFVGHVVFFYHYSTL